MKQWFTNKKIKEKAVPHKKNQLTVYRNFLKIAQKVSILIKTTQQLSFQTILK